MVELHTCTNTNGKDKFCKKNNGDDRDVANLSVNYVLHNF